MKIDGRLIASEIKSQLLSKISILKQKNIIPQLAVVLIGNDPSSEAYVRQKLKVGEEIGVKVSVSKEVGPRTRADLVKKVNKLNRDTSVHGIIVQRPLPIDISKEELDNLVIPQKDVDGFHPSSPFMPPITLAVLKILAWVYIRCEMPKTPQGFTLKVHPEGWQAKSHDSPGVEETSKNFINWLKTKDILVLGRGETAGKPIAKTFQKMGTQITIAHSKTENLKELCLNSNIIISCVGRPNIVRHDMVSPNTLLIGVGLHQENGKLKTDYNQEEIAEKVAYFTPVPGGVGPVNVACLFENLFKAVKFIKK